MLPFQLLIAFTFSSISYFMVGLVSNASAYFTFVLISFLTLSVANSFVAFVASVVPDESAGQIVILSVSAMYYLFSGFFVSRYDQLVTKSTSPLIPPQIFLPSNKEFFFSKNINLHGEKENIGAYSFDLVIFELDFSNFN
jgi:hypothetical protein